MRGQVLLAVVLVGAMLAGDVRAQDAAPAAPARTVAEQLQDVSLAAQIRKALADERSLRLFDFETEVEAGVVTLFGQVGTPAQAARAVELAQRVNGVKRLVNELVVTSSSARLVPAGPPQAESGTLPAGRAATTSSAQYHTVNDGESLWIIARRYDTSISVIKRLNNLKSNTVRPGQRLRIK